MRNKPILLIAGDPDSIFFEILFKSLKKKKYKSPLILVCNKELLINQMKYFKFKKKIRLLKINKINFYNLDNQNLNLLNVEYKTSKNFLKQKKFDKIYLENSFKKAFKLINRGNLKKILNGPINKTNFLKKKYFGITEYISTNLNIKNVGMLIYNKKLSVCPVTTHMPLSQVSKKITGKLISQKIDLVDNFFKRYINKKPRIAVTGLNPHCESIEKYNKDKTIIPAIIKDKIKQGKNVKGPYPSDTLFIKENRKKFDVIIGMYHDQVLGPIKTLFEYDAINITIGLPILRISPDHGPNTKMLLKNKSNPLSLIRGLEFLDNIK